jgi:epoxyqueuosine reductase
MGDRLFGCDECVLACPHRRDAPPCKDKEMKFYPDRAGLDLDEVLSMTDETFIAKFAGSPIARTGLERLERNAQICAAYAGNARGKRQ